MAFGNEPKDYTKPSGKTGFYACSAPPYEKELKINVEKKEQPKELSDKLEEIER